MKKYLASIYMLCGLAWIVRAIIGLYGPDYWDPQTTLDFAAVIGLSLGLLLLAPSLWGLYQQHPLSNGRKQHLWKAGITLAMVAAVVVGIENLIEDGFGVNAIGVLFPIGMLALFIGLLTAAIAAVFLPEIPNEFGWALLAVGFGIGSVEVGGGFLAGVALLALAWKKCNEDSDVSTPTMAP